MKPKFRESAKGSRFLFSFIVRVNNELKLKVIGKDLANLYLMCLVRFIRCYTYKFNLCSDYQLKSFISRRL